MNQVNNNTNYEIVSHRLESRDRTKPMTCDEANEILAGTTISIYPYNGKYKWFAIMSEQEDFDTPEEAFNDALGYLERGGY